jgi:Glycosyl hydrolases family 16
MSKWITFAVVLLAASCHAQNGCGATRNWTDPLCQVIGSGSLNSWWTVVSRHGEYGQNETECNIPSAVSVAGGILTITTSNSAYTCGDFNQNGTVKTAPATWPYSTGDIQWNTLNFTYGTVIVRAAFPNSNTGTWPSIWFMDSVCQDQNKYSGDPTGTCPAYGTSTYREMDMIECLPPGTSNWCNFTMHNGSSNPACTFSNPGTGMHVWVMTWSPGAASLTIDGASSGCSFSGASVPSGPLFMLIQNQTSSTEGPPNNANLPTTLTVDYVKVCNSSLTSAQCTAAANNNPAVVFYDDFKGTAPAPPTNLTATPH